MLASKPCDLAADSTSVQGIKIAGAWPNTDLIERPRPVGLTTAFSRLL